MCKGTEADALRRGKQGWEEFRDLDYHGVPMSLKRKRFDQSVVPVVFYGSGLSDVQECVHLVAARRMEKIATGNGLNDEKTELQK